VCQSLGKTLKQIAQGTMIGVMDDAKHGVSDEQLDLILMPRPVWQFELQYTPRR